MRQNNDKTEALISGEILAEMARQRRTKKWLAEETRIARTTLYRRLDGQSTFTLDEIFKISKALEIPVSVLFQEFDESRRAS